MHPKAAEAGAIIREHLAEIGTLYRADAGMKLTFLARNPSFPDGSRDMVVSSDDDMPAVIRALEIIDRQKAIFLP